MKVENPKRILVVKLSAIGDVLMATPVSHVLRKAFPDSYIAWVVEKKAADVVVGNPYLDEVIVWKRDKGAIPFAKSLAALRKQLRIHKFDVCIDLQGLIRSAGVCLLSGSKKRIGFADGEECSTLFYHEKYPVPSDANAQQRNLDLLRPIGVNSTDTAMYMPVMDEDREFAEKFLKENELLNEKIVAFCPATTLFNKHWTPEGWSDVANVVGEKYGARTLILGSKADKKLASKIVDGARVKPVVSAGQTTLKQAGALMERSAAVIGVDTGLLHMAVALDRPSVGLFGAHAWQCFIKKDNFIWVAKDFPCSPCHRHPTCKNVDCMRAITPADVEQAVKRWLE